MADLRLLVVIRQDGSLEDIRVLSSSGYAVLDEAAIKIVRMAAPYAPFPAGVESHHGQAGNRSYMAFSGKPAKLKVAGRTVSAVLKIPSALNEPNAQETQCNHVRKDFRQYR